MALIIWTEIALEDFDNLLEYIAKDTPITACRYGQQMISRIEMLQDHPELGSLVPEDDSNTYREIFQGNYRIIYRIEANTIYLVAIHHASRLLDFNSTKFDKQSPR